MLPGIGCSVGIGMLGAGGSAAAPSRAVKLTANGGLYVVVDGLINVATDELYPCKIEVEMKRNGNSSGDYSSLWALTNLNLGSPWPNSRYLQAFTGVGGDPTGRYRVTPAIANETVNDPSVSPNGHGYLPQALFLDGEWKRYSMEFRGAAATPKWDCKVNGNQDVHGSNGQTIIECKRMALGFIDAGWTGSGEQEFSYANLKIWINNVLSHHFPLNGADDLDDIIGGLSMTKVNAGNVLTDEDGP